MNKIILLYCCFFFSLNSLLCSSAPSENLITSLPGLADTITFSQYAGYITINSSTNKSLFYWFVESQRDPENDPVVFWTNGGPGASSLLGLFTEHGPFWPNSDGTTIHVNPYSWNRLANIIYIEDPCGVGFSYSDDPQDYITGDSQNALDNYNFLLKWFELYPEFASNDLYLAGESYGGHYIPELAQNILDLDTDNTLNVVGLALGNPFVDADSFLTEADSQADAYPFLNFLYTHAIVPVQAYTAASTACDWGDYLTDCKSNYSSPSDDCLNAEQIAINYVPSNYDVYNVLAPVCLDDTRSARARYVSSWNPLIRDVAKLQDTRVPKKRSHVRAEGEYTYDPCMQDYTVSYLNLEEVQTAIHANPTAWNVFEENLQYSAEDDYIDTIPLISGFLDNTNWRILVYSGDNDACVPFIGTQRWISCLGRSIKEDWRTWEVDDQDAGSVIVYDRITFITVKGSGHMVPMYTPSRAYELWQRWIDEESF